MTNQIYNHVVRAGPELIKVKQVPYGDLFHVAETGGELIKWNKETTAACFISAGRQINSIETI